MSSDKIIGIGLGLGLDLEGWCVFVINLVCAKCFVKDAGNVPHVAISASMDISEEFCIGLLLSAPLA